MGLWGACGAPQRPKIAFPHLGSRFWGDLDDSNFRPFWATLHPLLPQGTPPFGPRWAFNCNKFAFFGPNAGKIAILLVGNHFYSLGELQLWVFHRNWPNNGGGRPFLRYFGPNLALQRGEIGPNQGRFRQNLGVRKRFYPPGAPRWVRDPHLFLSLIHI